MYDHLHVNYRIAATVHELSSEESMQWNLKDYINRRVAEGWEFVDLYGSTRRGFDIKFRKPGTGLMNMEVEQLF